MVEVLSTVIEDLRISRQYSLKSIEDSCLKKIKEMVPSIQSSEELFSLLQKTAFLYEDIKIKLSVIVYAEKIKELGRIWNSLTRQSLKGIEIIVIGDTRKKYSDFLQSDQVYFVESKNFDTKEESILPYVHGDYVLIVDSEQSMPQNLCEYLYLYAKLYNSTPQHFPPKKKEIIDESDYKSFLKVFTSVFRTYEISDYLPKDISFFASKLYRRKILFQHTDFSKNNQDVCLVIIYNHNYEANIDKLEKIYKDRFHHIFHLVPFYTGQKENVIPVYQSSYHFCDYVRQGLPYFYNEKFSHYVFLADDLMINPLLNEQNIVSSLLPDQNNSCFVPHCRALGKKDILNWVFALKTIDAFLNNPGCQFLKFLPSYENACHIMKQHGIPVEQIPIAFAQECIKKSKKELTNNYIEKVNEKDFKEAEKLSNNKGFVYPLAMGFSDFFILPKEKIKEVCRMFGIFSAASVFTEVAIPMAILFNFKKVWQPQNLKLKIVAPQKKEERIKMINQKYNFNLDFLLNHFDEDLLFIHPVKLSQWKMKE